MTALAQELNLQITPQMPHFEGRQSYFVPEVEITIERTANTWAVNQEKHRTEFIDSHSLSNFVADQVVRTRFHLQDEPSYFAFEE